MHVHTCIYIYMCVHACMCVWISSIYTRMHTCICVHACVYVHFAMPPPSIEVGHAGFAPTLTNPPILKSSLRLCHIDHPNTLENVDQQPLCDE